MNNLKIAYIFAGHFRTFNPKWFHFHHNSDVFIHTYDRLGFWSSNHSVNMDTDIVSIDMIHRNFGNFSQHIKHIVIESENSKLPIIQYYAQIMESNKIHYSRPFNFISMHMKRLSALEAFFDFTNQHHLTYDIVFLFRPDFPFQHYDSVLPIDIANHLIYIEGSPNYNNNTNWYNDFFVIGNMSQLCKLKNIYIDTFQQYISNYKGKYDPHSYFHYLISTHFKHKFINCGGNLSLMNTPNGYCKA
jgi:hypothetical protein